MGRRILFLVLIIPIIVLSGCIGAVLDEDTERIRSDIDVLLYDEESDRLFIGTEDNGLFIYSPQEDRWIHRTTADGLSHNHVYCLAYDSDSNRLFLGTRGLNIYHMDEDRFSSLDENDGLPLATINSVAYNPHTDDLYMGYSREGFSIYNLDNGNLSHFNTENTQEMGEGFPSINVYAIVFDKHSGNMIIGGTKEISIFDPVGHSFSNFNSSQEFWKGLTSIKSFSLDELNYILYIATSRNAVWSFDLDDHTFFNYNITEHGIIDLALDQENQILYIATVKLRIMDLSTNSVIEKTSDDGLSSDIVQALALDSKSNTLYIGTNNGPGLTIYDIDNDSFRIIE